MIGSATAYFLASSPDFQGSIAIIERDTSFADGSTARSAGGIRQQFSTPANVTLSIYAEEFIRDAERLLSVDGNQPVIPFVNQGYLMLASENGRPVLENNIAIQRDLGATTELLDAEAIKARFPWINVDGITCGGYGGDTEGWTDPYALMQALRKKSISLGAELIAGEVIGIGHQSGRVEQITLADGRRFSAGHVVNAAGPRAAEIAAMVDIDLPVRSRKRFVYVLDCRDPMMNQMLTAPLTVDPSGVYCRPEGQQFICGLAPPDDQDPDCDDLEVDFDYFESKIWENLANRIPAFEAIKVSTAWAGHYAVNTLDHNALIGCHPAIDNLLFANGFSGHGLQQAPGVGRALSEWICYGHYRTIDVSQLSVTRIVSGDPVIETNVV